MNLVKKRPSEVTEYGQQKRTKAEPSCSKLRSLSKDGDDIKVSYEHEKTSFIVNDKTNKGGDDEITDTGSLVKIRHKQNNQEVNKQPDYQITAAYNFLSKTTSFYRYHPEVLRKEKQRISRSKTGF